MTPWSMHNIPSLIGPADHHDNPVVPPADQSVLGNNDNALVLTLGGWAFASGDNSLTDGEIHTNARDLGQVTMATGDATFIGAASGGQVVADANTFADVSGADGAAT